MVTVEQLRNLVVLDEVTGLFFWKEKKIHGALDKLAGGINGSGYRQLRIDGKMYQQHRLVWLYVTGNWPAHTIDHINHNRLDNRFCNLRDVENIINQRNKSVQSNNQSGIPGVRFNKSSNKWVAYVTFLRKPIHLGSFSTADEAVLKRKSALKELGFHDNHA